MKTRILNYSEVIPFILEAEQNGMILNERKKNHNDDLDWSGTRNLDTAIERATKGCKECSSLIEDTVVRVIRKQNKWGLEYKILNETSGVMVDPGLLSLGIPECFVIPKSEKKNVIGDEGIDIIANIAVSSGVFTNVIRNRGILACTIALIAERMEINTRILVGISVDYRDKDESDFVIVIKNYSQPLDLPLVAFYLISPAGFRRIGLSLFDSVKKDSLILNHGYPKNTKYKVERRKQIVIDHGMLRENMLNPESAVEEAVKILRTSGVIA